MALQNKRKPRKCNKNPTSVAVDENPLRTKKLRMKTHCGQKTIRLFRKNNTTSSMTTDADPKFGIF